MKLASLVLLFFTLPIFAQIGPSPTSSLNTWRVEQIYTLGNAVIRNGVVYVSLATNNVAFDPSGSPSQWGTIFSVGSTGTAAIVASEEVVPSSATPTFSISVRASSNLLTQNVTSFTLAAGAPGQEKTLTFCQNASGNFTVVPPVNVHGFMTVGVTLSKCSSQHLTYSSAQTAWLADSVGVINE